MHLSVANLILNLHRIPAPEKTNDHIIEEEGANLNATATSHQRVQMFDQDSGFNTEEVLKSSNPAPLQQSKATDQYAALLADYRIIRRKKKPAAQRSKAK